MFSFQLMLKFTRQFWRSGSTIRVNPEVKHALNNGIPVVALESTILTHGLPYPANLQMAQEVESIIRLEGCVPATMGYLNGEAVVGCDARDLEHMCDPGISKMKISRRDIPTVIARRITGGTTISTTMDLCNRVGIDIFSTGGLGGVSRPFELMDVSADLEELSRTPVGVVCSGPKSILDVGRTLEYLETKGVMVSTYIDKPMFQGLIENRTVKSIEEALALISTGNTLNVNVPGFYVRDSGIASPYVFENPEMAANLFYASKYQMKLPAGQVFCVPAPKEVELSPPIINKVIEESLAQADQLGVKGKELTPFLLGKINSVTNGESVKCNVEFVKNNAIIGCQIAKALSLIKKGELNVSKSINYQPIIDHEDKLLKAENAENNKVNTAIVGCVALDIICKTLSENPYMQDSNPGKTSESIGGVGFNVARATHMSSNEPVLFISAINRHDYGGQYISAKMEELNMPTVGLIETASGTDFGTAKYVSMHRGDGELVIACADMNIIEELKIKDVQPILQKYKPQNLVFDANISADLMNSLIKICETLDIKLIFEPTSVVKCAKISKTSFGVYPHSPISLVTPTVAELESMSSSFFESGKFNDIDGWFNVLDAIGVTSLRNKLDIVSNKHLLVKDYLDKGIFQRAFQMLPYFPAILLKDGVNGVTLVQINNNIKEACKASLPPSCDWTIVGSPSAGRHNLGVTIEHYPAFYVEKEAIASVTGAGDALLGSLVAQCGGSLPPFGSSGRQEVIQKAQMKAVNAITT